jgi:hypothetical protein
MDKKGVKEWVYYLWRMARHGKSGFWQVCPPKALILISNIVHFDS